MKAETLVDTLADILSEVDVVTIGDILGNVKSEELSQR